MTSPSPQSSPVEGEAEENRIVNVSFTTAVWIFLIALTAIRLSMLGTIDLSEDEAHYYMWSERLAPAYFSKGPGVAFAIRASTAIFGATETGVRLFSPILAAGTSLLMFYFGRRLFSARAAFWAVVALNCTLLFNVGSVVMTIDPLSIFFWIAAMITFWLAIERSPEFSFYWPATGLLVGLGFLCKYTNALEIVSILLVLMIAPRLRQEFGKPGLYCLLGAFVLCTLPPIIWNAQHAWVTLTHLRARGSLDEGFGIHPLEVLAFIGEHFLVYTPLLFLGLAWGVAGCWRRINQQFKALFLFWFGIPVFVFYLLLSINKVAAPNWDALAFPSLGLLAVSFWRERMQSRVWLQRTAAVALGLGLFMSVVALDTDLLRNVGIKLGRRDPTNRVRAWKPAAAAVEKLRNDLETQLGEKLFLIADDRGRASELAFYFRDKRPEGPGHPPVYLVESQDLANQFYFWPRYDEFVDASKQPASAPDQTDIYSEGGENRFVGRSALFIRDGARGSLVHNVKVAFQSCEPVALLEVHRYGVHLKTWRVFLCRNYRTLPL